MSTALERILNNPDQFPDDAEIVANGQNLGKAGDLRKEMKDRYMPKADMTALTEKAARERETLTRTIQEKENQAMALAQQLQAASQQRQQQTGTRTPLEELENDQYFGPVIKELRATQAEIHRHKQEFDQAKLVFNAKAHLDAISAVTRDDKDFSTDEGKQKIIEYMRSNGVQRADLAYSQLTRTRDIEREREKAKAEGIEEGKKLAKVPTVLGGGRKGTAPPANGPKTLDEWEQAVKGDQEILDLAAGVMRGEY